MMVLSLRVGAGARSETIWPTRSSPTENPIKNPIQSSYTMLKGDKRIAENAVK
jgi:hypothetical protein